MKAAGIITEYNPLHGGHVYLMEEVRRHLGTDTAIVCAMSGDFVQRGDFAMVRRHARAKAAVESGADLVVELPLPWAVGSAERFADGGVQTLLATGAVSHLAFGSECGDAQALRRVAGALLHEDFPEVLRAELAKGDSFPAARQRAAAQFTAAEDAAVLSQPNNILGVEYCKALLRRCAETEVFTVKRKGAAYHETDMTQDIPSATLIRALVQKGEREAAVEWMAPAMGKAFVQEAAAGRAPVMMENCERAILARLRFLTEEDFAAVDEGGEGVYHRLYEASREAVSVSEILEKAKTRRYAYARLRRMALWAYLGLNVEEFPREVPYIRVLAANERGRALLAKMRKTAKVPVVTKPADVRQLSADAQRVFEMEARAADLYALAYPDLSAAGGGSLWRQGPVML